MKHMRCWKRALITDQGDSIELKFNVRLTMLYCITNAARIDGMLSEILLCDIERKANSYNIKRTKKISRRLKRNKNKVGNYVRIIRV